LPKFSDLLVDVTKRSTLIRVLLYGDTGVGKTFLAGTAADVPEMRPVLFCDCDEGLFTLRHRQEHITYVAVRKFTDMQTVLSAIKKAPEKYSTLVLDNLAELYYLQMDARVRTAEERIPQLRDWQAITNRTRRLLRDLRLLPMHIIVTTPAQKVKDEVTGALYTTPELPGKLSMQIGRYFDVFGYLAVVASSPKKGLVRQLQVHPFRRIAAKDRSGNLPYLVENPTMQDIYDKIFEKKEE